MLKRRSSSPQAEEEYQGTPVRVLPVPRKIFGPRLDLLDEGS